MLRAVLFTALVRISCASVYPTTYPFENERNVPPSLPDTTPDESKVGTADDPGGYINRLNKCDPYADDRLSYTMGLLDDTMAPGRPAGFFECRPAANFASKWHHKTKNCTAAPAYALAKDVSGKVGSKQVCSKGSCCSEYDGLLVARNDHETWLQFVADTQETGLCTGDLPEGVYCSFAWMMWNCEEYFVKGKSNERMIIKACYDGMWNWYSTCPLLLSSRVMEEMFADVRKMEPQHYLDTLSNNQLNVLMPQFRTTDRVCLPYSYFVPEAGAESAASAMLTYFSFTTALLFL